jgi:hypothetical protein
MRICFTWVQKYRSPREYVYKLYMIFYNLKLLIHNLYLKLFMFFTFDELLWSSTFSYVLYSQCFQLHVSAAIRAILIWYLCTRIIITSTG